MTDVRAEGCPTYFRVEVRTDRNIAGLQRTSYEMRSAHMIGVSEGRAVLCDARFVSNGRGFNIVAMPKIKSDGDPEGWHSSKKRALQQARDGVAKSIQEHKSTIQFLQSVLDDRLKEVADWSEGGES